MPRPRNTSDQGERLSFSNTSGSTASNNVEDVQQQFLGLCDEDYSVQVGSTISAISDEASRIIYRLTDEPERTTLNEVLRVLEQKLIQEKII
ncbi:hypothetical protein J6590_028896 [Homalodisca vitripennis]|nr:hypothetical protein J6590_028896 [Homalodisca vitripennis]